MQTWPKFCGTVHYGQWDLATPISPPRSRGEWMTSWMTSWMMSWMTSCPSSTCFLLWLLPLFSTFWSFLWTGFSLWLHLTKKGLQSQCRLERYFFPGWKRITSSQSTCTQEICFLDRSQSLVLILEREWTLVRKRHDKFVLQNWDNNYYFFSSAEIFKSVASCTEFVFWDIDKPALESGKF